MTLTESVNPEMFGGGDLPPIINDHDMKRIAINAVMRSEHAADTLDLDKVELYRISAKAYMLRWDTNKVKNEGKQLYGTRIQ